MEQTVHALPWVHSISIVDDLIQHPLVGHVMTGAKHILARLTCKKEPITPDILQRLVSRFGGEGVSLLDSHACHLLIEFCRVFPI